jgi:hypothetical protein
MAVGVHLGATVGRATVDPVGPVGRVFLLAALDALLRPMDLVGARGSMGPPHLLVRMRSVTSRQVDCPVRNLDSMAARK